MSDHQADAIGYKLVTPPKVVGYWMLPGSVNGVGIKLSCYKKPRWITIKLMAWLLEFEYKEEA
jgi:hypothetical protein